MKRVANDTGCSVEPVARRLAAAIRDRTHPDLIDLRICGPLEAAVATLTSASAFGAAAQLLLVHAQLIGSDRDRLRRSIWSAYRVLAAGIVDQDLRTLGDWYGPAETDELIAA